jgi:hypothetical protein
MSRILRRPMFRGGSTSNEGIMSVPRKGYADIDEEGVQPDNSSLDGEFLGNSLNVSDLNINGPQMKTENNNIQQKNKTYRALGQDVEEGSIGDVMLKEYLGNRPDPMGKFLINFGLNYMSARPRGGKFGAITTAADAAKKPTEQLYADIDTDRLLKLKLMGALSKSESKVALEKEANLLVQEGLYKTKGEALSALVKARLEKKELSIQDRIDAKEKAYESKSLTGGSEFINKNKAEIFVRDVSKLGKDKEKIDTTNPWLENVKLTPKANSTDVEISGATENVLKRYSTGNIYINPTNRMSYEYLGKNIFRPVTKL